MTASGDLKVTLPRVEITVFFETLVVSDAAFDSFAKFGDGRHKGRSAGGKNITRKCRLLSAPGTEDIIGKIGTLQVT